MGKLLCFSESQFSPVQGYFYYLSNKKACCKKMENQGGALEEVEGKL